MKMASFRNKALALALSFAGVILQSDATAISSRLQIHVSFIIFRISILPVRVYLFIRREHEDISSLRELKTIFTLPIPVQQITI